MPKHRLNLNSEIAAGVRLSLSDGPLMLVHNLDGVKAFEPDALFAARWDVIRWL